MSNHCTAKREIGKLVKQFPYHSIRRNDFFRLLFLGIGISIKNYFETHFSKGNFFK